MEILFVVAILTVWNVVLSVGSVWLMIELKAMQKSTHQVTYLNPLAEENQEYQGVDEQSIKDTFKELERQGSIM